MAAIGRNDPCPCGSGKKHKRCCALAVDVVAQAAHLHDLDRGILEKLRPLLAREGFDVLRGVDDLADELGDDEPASQLLTPFVIYEQPVAFLLDEPDPSLGTASPAAILLARYPGRFDARERAWIANQANVKIRLWEVTAVERGVSLDLVDLESKDQRHVIERLGSTNMPLRSGVLARVVDFEGMTVLDGMHPRVLGPRGIVECRRVLEDLTQKRKTRTPFDRLMAFTSALDFEDEGSAQPPTLENFDGELVVPTNDRFTFPEERRSEILSALEAIEHCDRDEDPDDPEHDVVRYRLWKPGSRQHARWDETIVGQIEVRANVVLLRTNSVERADLYASKLARAFEGLAKRGLRDHEDAMAALSRTGATAPKQELSAGAREALAQIIRAHEDAWPDEPLPALGGKTARQAIKTKKGRAEVELLLREMEHLASKAGEGGMDPQRLRAALGL